MKLYCLLLSFFISSLVSAEEKPVYWNASAQKLNDSVYAITISAFIQPDWYIYASDDSTQGLEAVRLTWENDLVRLSKKFRPSAPASFIRDEVFGSRQKVYLGTALFSMEIVAGNPVPASLIMHIKAYCANGKAFLPVDESIELHLDGGVGTKRQMKIANVNLQEPLADCGDGQDHSKGLLSIFFIGFGGGLIALLTPCIFPLIPVTVSYFTGRSKTKAQGIQNALQYGSYILLIYLLASVPFHLMGNINPQVFNIISTNA